MSQVFRITPKRVIRSNGQVLTPDISITVTTRSHTTTPFYNGAVEIKEQYIVQSNVFSVTIIAGKRVIQCGNLQK